MNKKKSLSVLTPYLYITPISLILLTFVAGSLIIAICFSFTKYNIITPAEFNGLYNYNKLLTDSKLHLSIENTLKISIIAVPIQVIISTLFAILIASRRNTFLGKLTKAALFIPVLSSSAVVGTIWKAILNGGHPLVKAVFGIFGIDPTMLLGSSTTAIVTVALLIVWKGMGIYMIIALSAVISIPDSYYEAAKVDGANTWNQLIKITIPLLKPTIIMNTFLATVNSMQVFDMIYTMTGGGPSMSTTTLIMYAYQLTFKNSKAGYAMTVSVVLMAIIFVVVLFQQRFIKRDASEI
ncbi:MAG: carbohydrate ABC transporter permease [Dorea sp.]